MAFDGKFGTGTGRFSYDDNLTQEVAKEIFARFGLAIHVSNVLETSLLNYAFFAETFPKIGSFKDQAEWEAHYDRLFDWGYAQTFGNLIKHVEKKALLQGEDIELLRACKMARDTLVHHFMRDEAGLIYSPVGRSRMVEECHNATLLFEVAEKDLSAHIDAAMNKAGVDVEQWNRKVSDQMDALIQSGCPLDD